MQLLRVLERRDKGREVGCGRMTTRVSHVLV